MPSAGSCRGQPSGRDRTDQSLSAVKPSTQPACPHPRHMSERAHPAWEVRPRGAHVAIGDPERKWLTQDQRSFPATRSLTFSGWPCGQSQGPGLLRPGFGAAPSLLKWHLCSLKRVVTGTASALSGGSQGRAGSCTRPAPLNARALPCFPVTRTRSYPGRRGHPIPGENVRGSQTGEHRWDPRPPLPGLPHLRPGRPSVCGGREEAQSFIIL